MRRLSMLTTAILFLAQPALAACTAGDVRDRLTDVELDAVASAAQATPFGSGLIWTAQKDNSRITVVGTMHLFDPRLDPIVDDLTAAVADANLLLVEAGPQEEQQMTTALTQDPSLILLTDGTTLMDRMDAAAFDKLAQALELRGMPAVAAARLQPWYLSLTLAMPVCALADLQAGRRGLDAALMQVAADNAVPVQAVEPWDTLFDLMSADPIDVQVEQLQLSLMPDDLVNDMNATMLDRYFAGEIAELWELSRVVSRQADVVTPEEADALFTDMERQLVTGRNLDWMPVIAKATDAHDDVVLAVGAGHLPGASGVLMLLQNDGWTVTPGQ